MNTQKTCRRAVGKHLRFLAAWIRVSKGACCERSWSANRFQDAEQRFSPFYEREMRTIIFMQSLPRPIFHVARCQHFLRQPNSSKHRALEDRGKRPVDELEAEAGGYGWGVKKSWQQVHCRARSSFFPRGEIRNVLFAIRIKFSIIIMRIVFV